MKRTRYTAGFKARMVQRLLSPNAPLMKTVCEEMKIPKSTLSRWVSDARSLEDMGKKRTDPLAPPTGKSTREWSAAEKMRVVTAAAQLKDEELGEFLRREGVHVAQLDEWRADILTALGAPRRKEPDSKRVRELEREVARKDKALAEVTALLVLRKKLEALFGSSAEEGDSTDDENEKK